MYVGARMEQAKSAFVERLSSRDDYLQRDRISVSIDASGEGLYAYWFAINLGGTMQDGTILPERQYSSNWDGPWQGATARGDTYWTAEFFLPWTMMTLPYRPTGERTIGLYFQRAVADAGMDWGSPRFPEPKAPFYRCCPGCPSKASTRSNSSLSTLTLRQRSMNMLGNPPQKPALTSFATNHRVSNYQLHRSRLW